MEKDDNNRQQTNVARIRAIATRARWLAPLIALTTIGLSALELDTGPVSWAKPIEETAGRVTWTTGESAVCVFLALTMLIYWTVRERQAVVADLVIAAAWLTGIPGMSMVGTWVVKGTKIMFATLKRKVYEQIHADGHAAGRAEGHAEWQAWWRRRTITGVFVPDPNDPPPRPSD